MSAHPEPALNDGADEGLTPMTTEDVKQAVFGSFDGITSALGVIAGLIAAGAHSGTHILAADFGLAVAATVGMGAGEFLSDPDRNLRLAMVMGAATLIGSVAPAIPFATGYGTAQVLVSAVVVVLGGLLIGRLRGYRITFVVLVIVALVTVALSALIS